MRKAPSGSSGSALQLRTRASVRALFATRAADCATAPLNTPDGLEVIWRASETAAAAETHARYSRVSGRPVGCRTRSGDTRGERSPAGQLGPRAPSAGATNVHEPAH